MFLIENWKLFCQGCREMVVGETTKYEPGFSMFLFFKQVLISLQIIHLNQLHMHQKDDLSCELAQIYSRVSLECKSFIESDPQVSRQDTCKGLLALLEQLRIVLGTVNGMKTEQRGKHYHVTYNAITYILDISQYLRKSNYSFQIIPILVEGIRSMEENIILSDAKYLDKRTELYLKVSKIYEEWENYQQAVLLLESAVKSYKNLKALHEQDPPVPPYIQTILNNNLKLIKVYLIKYSIQAGSLPPADWKKKTDEEFPDDLQIRLMCLIECLKTQTKKHSNIFVKTAKNYKQTLLQCGFEMVKPFLEILSKGLSQQKQKIQREVSFKSNSSATQQEINEQIKKRRQFEQKFIRESEIKKASQACPLQYHAWLIHYALQMKSTKIITELIQYAQIRIECRRIEVPYVNDVMITVSNSPFPNVPNGYTKIPIDLNQANLIKELTRLRKSGKKGPEAQQLKPPSGNAPPAKQQKKDSKKAGKQPQGQPPPQPPKDQEPSVEATEWQLSEIKHKYVFMMVKKSMSPEGALYDLGVVLGNEEKGPVGYDDNRRIIVPYIQENMKVIESQIKQHTGVRQTTGLVPYIILYHSRNGLDNEDERKTVITDVAPLIGKNPMVPPRWGYKKIDVDLRQVPAEFIKAPNHDYVYLTYKTDELFHVSERHIRIIKAFFELESSWNQKKGGNNEDQKWMELEINYDVEKLNILFETIQQSLRGELGQEYYRDRCDFLTNLTFQIWSKYLKNPLLQLDYMREQRLNGQIIDYDYDCYKSILDKCSPTFLRGLKVMNVIMVNNPKADILLSTKINLELAKLLEENKLYKVAAGNVKLCLDKLRRFRDDYLSKGVEGNADRLLPFSITCSNADIKLTITQMREKYHQQRRMIQKALRVQDRRQRGEKQLSPEQLQEEEKQFIRFRKTDAFDEIISKVGTAHSQVYSIVAAIELDLLNLYFRISLKRSEQLTIMEQSRNDMTNGIKNTELQGLASTLKKKLTLNEGPTQTKNIQNLTQLQNTLVKANQLPPPRPKLQKMQAKLMSENKKNPYSMVLLMVNLAAQNSDNKDKKYYLEEGLRYLQQCRDEQSSMMGRAVDNAIFIFSGLWDNKIVEKEGSQNLAPFSHLYTSVWQKETEEPEPPILMSKNSTSIHLKLPPFVPRRRNPKEEIKTVKYMSIYGKASANGVDVSLNCIQLQGTGVRKDIGKTVKVSSLAPNNLYCFAAAAIDTNDENMGIGKTGQDIGTFNPLSIPMLASYLAKISYQINQYEVAQRAVGYVLKEYCQQSNYLSRDERINNQYFYAINEERIRGVSLLEIKCISEAIYIAALCQRRKLTQIKQQHPIDRLKVVFEERERLITNLLMLSGCLAPSLTSPNISIPFLIPEHAVLHRAMTISMIPQKWMNPKIRRLGTSVMSRLLKWGLQNNEVSLARRLVYRWNERKYLLLGKMIQVEEKKEVKKGAKEPKDQQVKMIDKYCRMMIEKSPLLMDAFEDSMITISEEYYDYVSMFVERAKEQIATLAQYVDNPSEEIDALNSHLSLKLELVEYLKDPLQSIKKIPNNSPYYFEYNSKILTKALESASQAQYKTVLQKSQELDIPEVTDQIKIAQQIYKLIFTAIREDIGWTPSSKLELIEFQKNTGKDLNKAISIFSSWEEKKKELSDRLGKVVSLQNRFKDFDYLNMWISELYHLKAQCHIINCCNQFQVKRKISTRYDKIKAMNIEDLFKKEKEVSVLDESAYMYTEEQLKKLTQILAYLCQSVYASLLVSNWLKLQSTLKFLNNLLIYIQITPFYHKKTELWTYFAFLSLAAIQMLTSIRKKGFWQFKERYNQKLMNTELTAIGDKLQSEVLISQPLIDGFTAEYYQPDLESSTTKSYWFMKEKQLDIEPIGALIAYTVNTLRLQNKHQMVINIVRDFCNVTQHYFSLMLLPFMTSSQTKLLEDVERMIQKESEALLEVTNSFNAEKQKMGKKRAYLMSGEKMPFEKEYEENSQKIKDSLKFLNNQKDYIENQINKSNRIKDDITRDTSKQVLAQQEQRKYTLEFGQHYEQMYREFGEDAKHVKKTKNFIKDIINKYDAIYSQLKNSKTSKDTLAEIQNRNDVGNLWFASGYVDKAEEFWGDSLATIFRKVKPIENYHQILAENKPYLVKAIGQKQVVMAICLLYKISHFCSQQRLNIQKSAVHFACHLAYCLFETSLQYPQSYLSYKDYRIKSFPNPNIFMDQSIINLTELISALEYFTLNNLYEQNSLAALPLVSFYEYLGTDVVKHPQSSIKAKIYKAILLAESGLVAESITYLVKVANEKDMPILWLNPSELLKKEKGMNWVSDAYPYNSTQLWTNSQNKAIIEDLKKLGMKPETSLQNGLLNQILFNYAKALALFKIFEVQMSKDQALNEQRVQSLGEAELILRDCLKRMAIVEEFFSLLQQWEENRLLFKQNEVNDEFKKQMENSKSRMIQFLKKNGVEEAQIKWYQKEESSPLKRSIRLELICRIRFSLHKIYQARNILVNSYHVLKNALNNAHRYSIGARLCQTGFDPEIKAPAPSAPVAGKKDDKKGGKKQEEVPQVVAPPPLDPAKEKQLQQTVEAKPQRKSMSSYWHIKLIFEIGRLLYRQNNFKECIQMFELTMSICKKYQQEYFLLHSQGYVARAKLRLGYFEPQQFKSVISALEAIKYQDQNYLTLVMDFGELLSGQPSALQYLNKGKAVAQNIWSRYGMKSVLSAIGTTAAPRNYYLKEELTAEQEQLIKRKKKGEKKGGKDEKKGAAKKEDPKKKKDENKIEYKVGPLSKLLEVNLLEEEKYIFGEYILNPHPNYTKNNIYQPHAYNFIKTYLRVLTEQLHTKQLQASTLQVKQILDLLEVLNQYPYPTDHLKIGLYACLGKLHKNCFLTQLRSVFSKQENQLKRPFEDLPLNATLIQISTYSQFLTKNRQLLTKAKQYFKISLNLLSSSTLLYQRSLSAQEIAWQYAENQCLLAQYVGRDKPKFFPEDQAGLSAQDIKLNSLNDLAEAFYYLQLAVRIKTIKFQLQRNYMEIGAKGLDPTAKIDEDISSQILEIDKQCKRGYPQFLVDSLKGKTNVSGTDLVTYMLKAWRESQFMTFSNSSNQNTIYKCNRILTKSLQQYKEKCLIGPVEVPLRKNLKEKFVDAQTLIIKSVRNGSAQCFLYIVGPLSENEPVYFGRVNIELHDLSKLTEDLLALGTKAAISDRKSEAVKERDYILHRREFKRLLLEISVRFGNPQIDGKIKPIDDQWLVELTRQNLNSFNKILDPLGTNCKSKHICKFWRKLHEIKYYAE